jgi:hypothetical protein
MRIPIMIFLLPSKMRLAYENSHYDFLLPSKISVYIYIYILGLLLIHI